MECMSEKILVFDIETTGMPRRQLAPLEDSSNWPYIVQIAWILFDHNATELHRADYIIKPTDYFISQAATNVHGVAHDFALAHGKDATMVLGTLYELLLENAPTLVGHNIKFDTSITQAELLRHKFENIMKPLPHLCTMNIALKVIEVSGNRFPKLSELHYHLFNTDFIGHHRAMSDVEATARCFFEMKRLVASGEKLPPLIKKNDINFAVRTKDKMVLDISNNLDFIKAVDLVQHTKQSFFLTGRAGTGKSTFLKFITSNIEKNFIVVAPTGIAALNVGGVTIHSFFRFPLRPLLPDDEDIPKLNFAKQKLIKEMDTLVIDEISMVRVDVLDAIDASLRKNGGRPNQPFGGKQVIFIGDIFQLEPVTEERDGTKDILLQYYESLYFFKSQAFQSPSIPNIVELQKVYRQKDDLPFLTLLDKIRVNNLDTDDFTQINATVDETPLLASQLLDDTTIVLKTTNYEAEYTNNLVLDSIDAPSFSFTAIVSGEFNVSAYRIPAPETLKLRVGAQVMLLRNDLHGRWVNGTLAKVSALEKDKIKIRLQNEEEHEIGQFTWENITYQYNHITRKIETKILGGYTQFPLRLAWAITIHKSQGLTFDKIKIDWGQRTFASGQVYVALSRCRKLSGISMSRPLHPNDIIVNQELIDFQNHYINSKKI